MHLKVTDKPKKLKPQGIAIYNLFLPEVYYFAYFIFGHNCGAAVPQVSPVRGSQSTGIQ